MSNHKYAYGWSGHILCRASEVESDRREAKKANVIPVADDVFDRIAEDHGNCTLDPRIQVEQLGWLSIETVYFLATGTGFTEGWTFYGAPFEEAESRLAGEKDAIDRDAEYLAAMQEVYGLRLPPCRLMIGCASEH